MVLSGPGQQDGLCVIEVGWQEGQGGEAEEGGGGG